MDIECDRIREIRNNLGLEVNDVPTSFFFRDKIPFRMDIINSLNELVINNKKNNINGCIENIVLIIYNLLNTLVQQGIYPDNLLQLMIFDDLQKIWPDKTSHYNKRGAVIYPENYESISRKIDNEILSMKNGNYQKVNKRIGRHYSDIINYYKISNKEYNEQPTCINEKDMVEYQLSLCFALENYGGCCDYVEEEAECLVNCLYKTMKLCVEMGFNPEKYVDELIDAMEKKSSKIKSK